MDLEARVKRLESGGRRWRASAIVLGVALVSLVAMGQAHPLGRSYSEYFIVRDPFGNEPAALGSSPVWQSPNQSFGLLTLYDSRGDPRIVLNADDTPFITVLGPMREDRSQQALWSAP
jgi:hypothetical protein